MVSKEEMKRVIEKTKKNEGTKEQWGADTKVVFIANIESLMVFLAHRTIDAKNKRWGEGPKRILPSDVNAAFGEIWPKLFKGDTDE